MEKSSFLHNKVVIPTGAYPDFRPTTYAAFRRERRMKFASATKFHRKSGGAERRDLRFLFPVLTHPLNPRPFPQQLGHHCRMPGPGFASRYGACQKQVEQESNGPKEESQ